MVRVIKLKDGSFNITKKNCDEQDDILPIVKSEYVVFNIYSPAWLSPYMVYVEYLERGDKPVWEIHSVTHIVDLADYDYDYEEYNEAVDEVLNKVSCDITGEISTDKYTIYIATKFLATLDEPPKLNIVHIC